jgi:hypothetical protein
MLLRTLWAVGGEDEEGEEDEDAEECAAIVHAYKKARADYEANLTAFTKKAFHAKVAKHRRSSFTM